MFAAFCGASLTFHHHSGVMSFPVIYLIPLLVGNPYNIGYVNPTLCSSPTYLYNSSDVFPSLVFIQWLQMWCCKNQGWQILRLHLKFPHKNDKNDSQLAGHLCFFFFFRDMFSEQYPRKLQHTLKIAHPRQSPWPTMKGSIIGSQYAYFPENQYISNNKLSW